MNHLVFAFLVVFIAIVVCFMQSKNNPDFDWMQQVAGMMLGIFGSIVASVIYCLLESANDQDREEKQLKIFHEIDQKLDSQMELYAAGVVSLRKKSYYDQKGKFWLRMIESTSDHLDLIGHSCKRWFDGEYRDAFISKIQKMMKKHKEVHIILSGAEPDMKKVKQTNPDDIEDAHLRDIEYTCVWLYQIWRKACCPTRKYLKVYIADRAEVTHMYIRTDTRCYVAPYVLDKANNRNSVLLELNKNTEYSKCFEDNFKDLLNSKSTKRIWFGEDNG